MAYVKQTWVDDDGSQTVGTPVTAARMNHIEDGIATVQVYDTDPIGVPKGWTGSTVPEGYLLMNGQVVTEANYPQLVAFAAQEAAAGNAIWTGSVSGVSPNRSVVVPDWRDRFLYGSGALALGAKGGAATVKLTSAQSGSPPHQHGIGLAVVPGGGYPRVPYTLDGTSTEFSLANAAADAAQAHENLPPYVVLAWILKAKGATMSASVIQGPPGTAGADGVQAVTAWTRVAAAGTAGVPVAFGTGWGHYDLTTWGPVEYRKVGDEVQVRGAAAGAGAAAYGSILVFGAGWRPGINAGFPKPYAAAAGDYMQVVAATGTLSASGGAALTWLTLDHIRFSTLARTAA